MRIGTIDLAIIVFYLVGVTLFGLRYGRKQHSIRDYFLGGRSAPWWALACSIVATETSTLTIISTPGIAYETNLAFLQLVIGYLVARVILCIILIPQYFRGEFFTAYQLLEKRFGARTKSAAASIFVVTRALAEGVRFAAIGKVVSVALGFNDRLSVGVITLLTLLYTFEGGMRAVIWTDVVQFFLYIAGSLAAFFLLLHRIPMGWAGVTHAAAFAGDKLRVFDFHFSLTQSYTFWSGLIGGTFLTMASHGTDQTMVQRLLAARSERDSKKALLASGVIIFAQFALFLVIGVMLYVYRQHIPFPLPEHDPDRLFPEFIVTQMPVGLVGIVLAAIFAVAMSNASGSLNSLASSSMIDFSRARRHGRIRNRCRWQEAGAPFASMDHFLGHPPRNLWHDSLGASLGGRIDHRFDYLRELARHFSLGHLEPARHRTRSNCGYDRRTDRHDRDTLFHAARVDLVRPCGHHHHICRGLAGQRHGKT